MEFPLKVTFNSFFEMKDPASWRCFLSVKRPNFQSLMRSDAQSVYSNVAWSNLGKLFFVENVYAFK